MRGIGLDADVQRTLEIAAIVHDIACPLCREKYGSTEGKLQEKESAPLVRDFLKEAALPDPMLNRMIYLVEHHHTLGAVEGLDYQILLEADYLVNADEGRYMQGNVQNALYHIFRTQTGISLLKSIYQIC